MDYDLSNTDWEHGSDCRSCNGHLWPQGNLQNGNHTPRTMVQKVGNYTQDGPGHSLNSGWHIQDLVSQKNTGFSLLWFGFSLYTASRQIPLHLQTTTKLPKCYVTSCSYKRITWLWSKQDKVITSIWQTDGNLRSKILNSLPKVTHPWSTDSRGENRSQLATPSVRATYLSAKGNY